MTEVEMENKGTKIEIELTDYNLQYIKGYLEDESNRKKIINAFDDKEFIIELKMIGVKACSKDLEPIKDMLKKRQLFRIRYSSDEGIVYYYHDESSKPLTMKDTFLINVSEEYKEYVHKYSIELDWVVFHFKPGDIKEIDHLFYNNANELVPLIYINSNLFSNYSIFNPNVVRKQKSKYALPQIIGYAKLICSDSQLDFNSDRTNLIQNALTDTIQKHLETLYMNIQIKGSEIKQSLFTENVIDKNLVKKFNSGTSREEFKKAISEQFTLRDFVKITPKNDHVVFSLFGSQVTITYKQKKVDPVVKPVIFKLEKDHDTLILPVNSFDMLEYVEKLIDSSGNQVPITGDYITIDGDGISGTIHSQVTEECEGEYTFTYHDEKLGDEKRKLTIDFKKRKTTVATEKKKENLFKFPGSNASYKISYNNTICSAIDQINKLSIDEYEEIIACSLRAIFEISIDAIDRSNKLRGNFKKDSDLQKNVLEIIKIIGSSKSNLSEISNKSGIGFKDLKNMLNPADFTSAISMAHLGAHKSTVNSFNIEFLAAKLALFVVLSNEIINNRNLVF